MKTNVKNKYNTRLAGGSGAIAATQNNEAYLSRLVLTCLLWEDSAYIDGKSIVEEIKSLISKVSPKKCFELAVQARSEQKLRHVPLLVIREMCRYPEHKKFVRDAVVKVCTRPDQLTELLSLYWLEGKIPLCKQLKIGMAEALCNFDRHQISKWNKDNKIKLRDILFLTHPKPKTKEQEALFKDLAENKL
jgi:hypothetical protein